MVTVVVFEFSGNALQPLRRALGYLEVKWHGKMFLN
ncbi:acetyltransferase [Vibrio cholerae]|nr:acetyltransferase [Vibrio cholerae]TXZ51404.1 acetyltransferase [Vibrio cholerae]